MNDDIDDIDETEVEVLGYNNNDENQVESNYINTTSNNINNKKNDNDKNIRRMKIGIVLLSVLIIVVASIGYFKKSNKNSKWS